jgi:hypothetical protein
MRGLLRFYPLQTRSSPIPRAGFKINFKGLGERLQEVLSRHHSAGISEFPKVSGDRFFPSAATLL